MPQREEMTQADVRLRNKLPVECPYRPVKYEARHAYAVQALERGDCPPDLQQEFLRWLINDVCGTYDQSYRPNQRDTDFAEGKRFAGNTVVKLLHLKPSSLRREENEPTEQP